MAAFAADVHAHYGARRSGVALLRSLVNPSVRACLLVRVRLSGPAVMSHFARIRLLARYGIDISRGAAVGPGLNLPHPVGIVIGEGAVLGARVTLYQHVTLGAHRGGYPVLGNNVTVFPGAVVVGNVTIGDSALIGANSYVAHDVSAGERVRGGSRV